jgi:hypothetical protein
MKVCIKTFSHVFVIELLNKIVCFSFLDNLNVTPPPKPSRIPMDRSAPPLPPKKRNFSFEELLDATDSTMNVPSFNDEMDFKDNFRMNTCNSFKMNSHKMNFESIEYRSNNVNEIDMISNRLTDVEIRLESTDMAMMNTKIIESNTSSSIMSRSTTHQQVFLEDNVFDTSSEEHPPPLPVKMRSKKSDIHKSVYDNLDDSNRDSLDTKNSTTSSNSSLTSSLSARFDIQQSIIMKNKYKSCIETSNTFFDKSFGEENPPPLPPKQKKHSK